MNFQALLSIILTLFLLLICGYFCRKTGIIDTTASKKLSRLILSVGQPMLIVASLNNAEYSKENLDLAWKVTLLGFVLHAVVAVGAYWLCRIVKRNPDKAKIFEFSLVFGNCGFIGFPILDSLLGEGVGSFLGAFFVISFHLFFWTWGILIFARGREDIRLTPKKILLNFGTVPCAIGVVLYLLLATISLKQMFSNWKLYLHSLLKLILMPVGVCVLAKLCGLSPILIQLATAMTAVPCAASVTMLAELYDIEPGYASQTVGMTSIFCTATLPAVMLLAQWVIAL